MAKKVVIDPEDFDKLVQFVTNQSVPFHNLKPAAEVDYILRNITVMDIQILSKKETE